MILEHCFWKEIMDTSDDWKAKQFVAMYYTMMQDQITVLPDGRVLDNFSFRASGQFITYFGNSIGNVALHAAWLKVCGISTISNFLSGKSTVRLVVSGDDSVTFNTEREGEIMSNNLSYWNSIGYLLKDPDMPVVDSAESVDFCSHFFRMVPIGEEFEYMPIRSVSRIMTTLLMDLSASSPNQVGQRMSLLKGVLLTTRATYYPIPWVRFLTEAGLIHLIDVDPKADWRHRDVMVAHPSSVINKVFDVDIKDHNIGFFSRKELEIFGNNASARVIETLKNWDPSPAFDRLRRTEMRSIRKAELNITRGILLKELSALSKSGAEKGFSVVLGKETTTGEILGAINKVEEEIRYV